MTTAELRAALQQRNEEHGTDFHLLVNEDEALDLASGRVPQTVKAMAATMLDWIDTDNRNALANAARSERKKRHA